MFQELFNKIDEFIDKFSEITKLDEVAIQVLRIIEKAFSDNISEDKELCEKTFDEIMQKPGLWKSIGAKMKKALKSKEDLLKYLLYISTVMNEFDRKYREKQRENRKYAELKKIIEKYSKIIKELSENKNLSKEQIETEIKKVREKMQKELKDLSFIYER